MIGGRIRSDIGEAAGSPGPFTEIVVAHTAFAVFELGSAQVGSGRPPGPRSELWGVTVLAARAALEAALRRLHLAACSATECAVEKAPLDPTIFRRFAPKLTAREPAVNCSYFFVHSTMFATGLRIASIRRRLSCLRVGKVSFGLPQKVDQVGPCRSPMPIPRFAFVTVCTGTWCWLGGVNRRRSNRELNC